MASTKTLASDGAPTSAKAAPLGGGRSLATLALDRVLPSSMDAEAAVLGAMLLSPAEAGSQARERLDEGHFYFAAHQSIFREIAALQDALHAVDLVTITQRLQDKNQLEEIGGPAYLADLVTRVPTAANIEHYIDIVWEKYLLRQLIGAAHDIIAKSFEQQDDVKAWVDQVEQQIFNITAERTSTTTLPIKDLTKQAMAHIELLFEKRGSGSVTGLATGFRDLDKLTGGFHPGNMIVIAGRPSMGKTALAMNIAEHVAMEQNKPVGIFSLEMSANELVLRALCSGAKVSLKAIRDGFPHDRDHHSLTAVASRLIKAPMYIDDSAGLTINQVRARARRMKLQFDIQLLVIDYLQLMRAPSRRADQSRQVEVADISAGIKALAKELAIPIVVLSQLNRQPDSREENRPRLSDLRESGTIEQDADLVGLLVRPEVYADNEQDRASERGKATLVIAKQRNGPTDDINLTFLGEYTRFEDSARVEREDVPDSEGSEG